MGSALQDFAEQLGRFTSHRSTFAELEGLQVPCACPLNRSSHRRARCVQIERPAAPYCILLTRTLHPLAAPKPGGTRSQRKICDLQAMCAPLAALALLERDSPAVSAVPGFTAMGEPEWQAASPVDRRGPCGGGPQTGLQRAVDMVTRLLFLQNSHPIHRQLLSSLRRLPQPCMQTAIDSLVSQVRRSRRAVHPWMCPQAFSDESCARESRSVQQCQYRVSGVPAVWAAPCVSRHCYRRQSYCSVQLLRSAPGSRVTVMPAFHGPTGGVSWRCWRCGQRLSVRPGRCISDTIGPPAASKTHQVRIHREAWRSGNGARKIAPFHVNNKRRNCFSDTNYAGPRISWRASSAV